MNEVVLNLQILEEKVGRLFVVGEDATYFRGGDEDIFRFLFRLEAAHRGRIKKIQFLVRAANEIFEPLPLQLAPDRAADHAAVPCHVNFCFVIHDERPAYNDADNMANGRR